MNFYPEDYIVQVIVPFTDLNDQSIVPTQITAVLTDGDTVELVDFGIVSFTLAAGQVTITVPAVFNSLAGTEAREARILTVELTTVSGVVTRTHSYVIEAVQTLQIMTNTFMTAESAEILALDSVHLSGWRTADDTAKRAALVEAYNNIVRLPMHFYGVDVYGDPILSEEIIITRVDWFEMTPSYFLIDLPSHFRRSLRQAQLAEANELLIGDSITRRQRAGIISETIGESSVTLSGNQINYGLSQAALGFLAGYIYVSNRLART